MQTKTLHFSFFEPEIKKMEDSNNACVCSYRSLKLLTDDHSDFVAV